jgi:hypothetical protein
MVQSPMRYSLFISLLLLVSACSQKTRPFVSNNVACFRSAVPVFSSTLYDASIDVMGHYVSGLLFVKKMTDQSHRVVFTNEAGLTFFDFEWNEQGIFKTHRVVKKLDKEIVIRALRKDLELLIVPAPANALANPPKKKEFVMFYSDSACRSITSADVIKNDVKLAEAVFLPAGKNVPDSVRIAHNNFNMKIVLKRIER